MKTMAEHFALLEGPRFDSRVRQCLFVSSSPCLRRFPSCALVSPKNMLMTGMTVFSLKKLANPVLSELKLFGVAKILTKQDKINF